MKKNYEEINRYEFRVHYFMQYAVGTKYERSVEISKNEYNEFVRKLNNSKNNMIRFYKTYTVGFYSKPGTYVTQEVDKEVFDCLYKSQRYEKNKRNNEKRRYLDTYFDQNEFLNMQSKDDVENEVIERLDKEKVKSFLDSTLYEKQSNRFYKNKIEGIPIIVIAIQENTDPSSVRESIERAKRTLAKNYKKYKKL